MAMAHFHARNCSVAVCVLLLLLLCIFPLFFFGKFLVDDEMKTDRCEAWRKNSTAL
jgi:hypothetical protein